MYDIYAKTDEQNRILDIRADWNGQDVTGMTLIGQQSTAYATDIYCPKGLYDGNGIPVYKLENGVVAERTQEEIDADIAALPVPEPSPQEQTDTLMLDHEERLIYLELGVNDNAVSGS